LAFSVDGDAVVVAYDHEVHQWIVGASAPRITRVDRGVVRAMFASTLPLFTIVARESIDVYEIPPSKEDAPLSFCAAAAPTEQEFVFSVDLEHIVDAEFSPDSDMLAAIDEHGRISVWAASTYVLSGCFEYLYAIDVGSTEFSWLDSTNMIVSSEIGFGVWPIPRTAPEGPREDVHFGGRGARLACSPNERLAAFADPVKECGFVFVHFKSKTELDEQEEEEDTATRILRRSQSSRKSEIGVGVLPLLEHGVRDWWTVDEEPLCLAYSPDGKHCAVGALDGHLKIFNAETGYSLKVALMDPKTIYCVAFNREGTTLAVGGESSHIELLNIVPVHNQRSNNSNLRNSVDESSAGPGEVELLLEVNDEVHGIAFTTDDRFIVASAGQNVCVWTMTGDLICEQHVGPIQDVDVNAKMIAVACGHEGSMSLKSVKGEMRAVCVWDWKGTALDAPAQRLEFPEFVFACKFSPDSSRLLCADDSGNIRVYDTRDWSVLFSLKLTGGVRSASWACDSTTSR
jgi:WD40 repeat protein